MTGPVCPRQQAPQHSARIRSHLSLAARHPLARPSTAAIRGVTPPDLAEMGKGIGSAPELAP